MSRLLILADDFTGALDTGVQFAARGAVTRVVTDPTYDFAGTGEDVEVLVMDAETRHLGAAAAHDIVSAAVKGALTAGFTHIYKKTDSALRGNIGAELSAVPEAAGEESLVFIPSFPKMNRVVREGVLYIDGLPVAESVFGLDPFEPVRHSAVAEIIAEGTDTPVSLIPKDEQVSSRDMPRGIIVYDAGSEDELKAIGESLGPDGLRLSAGCAGFAPVLADILGISGEAPERPILKPSLFIVCGSVNPVTLRQMKEAEEAGFIHIHLRPEQKLDPAWADTAECRDAVADWLRDSLSGRCILDVNDPEGAQDTDDYISEHGLTVEEVRVSISSDLARLVKMLLDGGLDATILCTGGDTLLALMKDVGVAELQPIGEVATGSVLTSFTYREKTYYIISKSGGFGEPELFIELADLIGAGS